MYALLIYFEELFCHQFLPICICVRVCCPVVLFSISLKCDAHFFQNVFFCVRFSQFVCHYLSTIILLFIFTFYLSFVFLHRLPPTDASALFPPPTTASIIIKNNLHLLVFFILFSFVCLLSSFLVYSFTPNERFFPLYFICLLAWLGLCVFLSIVILPCHYFNFWFLFVFVWRMQAQRLLMFCCSHCTELLLVSTQVNALKYVSVVGR